MLTLTRSRRKSVVRFEPETLTYQAAIAAAGGTMNVAVLRHVDDFVVEAKARGFWSALIEVGPFCGDNLAAALVKLKHAGQVTLTNTGFVGGDYVESGVNGGLNGGNNKSLNTGYVMTSGDNLIAFNNRTAVDNAANRVMIGTRDSFGNEIKLYHTSTGADGYDRAPGSATAVRANETGFYSGHGRPLGTGIMRLAVNGVDLATDTGSSVLNPDTAMFLWARNNNGIADQFWTGRGSFYAIGGSSFSSTMVMPLSDAVRKLQQKLNRL
jgi:hypothetical protein